MSEPKPIYLIQPPLKHAGFSAYLLTVLNHIRYCEREGLTPVVHIDAACETKFLDPEYGDNAWEQYFEPVGPYSSAELKRMLADPAHGHIASTLRQADLSIVAQIKANPDSIFTWTFGHWRTAMPADLPAWFEAQRRKGRETVRKYVRIKPHILDKVDRFFERNMQGRHILGVHIRGTDLHYAPPVSPAEYFASIEQYLEAHPDAHIFLATDQVQYLELMKKRYGDIVHYYDCLRSSTSTAPFNSKIGSPYQKGEDVLIDILLLSRCNFFIRGASNVPEMVIFFSDQLPSEDLSLNKRFAFGQDYFDRWSSLATRPAWEMIKDTDLEQVAKHAASQSTLHKLGYEWRRACSVVVSNRRRLRRNLRRLLGLQKS